MCVCLHCTIGTSSWKEQFTEALTVSGGDDDEEGGEDGEGGRPPQTPSAGDYLMHCLTIFWKVLFAFVPPTSEYLLFFLHYVLFLFCMCWYTDCFSRGDFMRKNFKMGYFLRLKNYSASKRKKKRGEFLCAWRIQKYTLKQQKYTTFDWCLTIIDSYYWKSFHRERTLKQLYHYIRATEDCYYFSFPLKSLYSLTKM